MDDGVGGVEGKTGGLARQGIREGALFWFGEGSMYTIMMATHHDGLPYTDERQEGAAREPSREQEGLRDAGVSG